METFPDSSWQRVYSSRICAISSFSQSVDRLIPLLHFVALPLVLYLSLHHSAHIFYSLTLFHSSVCHSLSRRAIVQHSCSQRGWAISELASVVFPPLPLCINQLMYYPQSPNSLNTSYEKPSDWVSPADVAAVTRPNIIKGLMLTSWLSVTLHYYFLWNITFLSLLIESTL